ncbi:MAG: 5'/3'-nucleotidase SurE [Rhodothermales bacterium]
MQSEPPLILICNDDGIDAPGIVALASAMDDLGDVYVVAPVDEQSAVGHAITFRDPVRARPWEFRVPSGHVPAFAVTGTPADCAKLAVNHLLPRTPNLVVSGINRGPNTAVNVIYSGTVSAATEASILGVDAIAFSLCTWEATDYEAAARYAQIIARKVLRNGMPPGVLFNVNIPALPFGDIKGIAVTRQAHSRWEESFVERTDPLNQPYYWLSGRFVNLDDGEHTDLAAVEGGFVSLTPIQYDLTAHSLLSELRTWSWRDGM